MKIDSIRALDIKYFLCSIKYLIELIQNYLISFVRYVLNNPDVQNVIKTLRTSDLYTYKMDPPLLSLRLNQSLATGRIGREKCSKIVGYLDGQADTERFH